MAIKKRSKFNVDTSDKGKKKRTYNGIIYDSELEMRFFRDYIEPKIASGEIIKYDRQVKYELQKAYIYNGKKINAINLKSDFDITYSDGTFKVVDTKGMLKPEDIIKKKLFNYKYPHIDFSFIGFSKLDGGWVDIDLIAKSRKERKKLKKVVK